MSKSNGRSGKSKAIISYILCLVIFGVSIVYTINNTDKKTVPEKMGELPVENWENDNSNEGSVDKIINQTVTEETTIELVPDPFYQFTAETAIESEDVFSEPDSSFPTEQITEMAVSNSESVVAYSEDYTLSDGQYVLKTAVDWSYINANQISPSKVSYSSGIYDISISLEEGNITDYAPLIELKASELGAGFVSEKYLFSPTRMTDTYEYDKYTLVYTQDDNQYVAYYYLSQATDNRVYMITIRGTQELPDDSDIFGVLNYSVETVSAS